MEYVMQLNLKAASGSSRFPAGHLQCTWKSAPRFNHYWREYAQQCSFMSLVFFSFKKPEDFFFFYLVAFSVTYSGDENYFVRSKRFFLSFSKKILFCWCPIQPISDFLDLACFGIVINAAKISILTYFIFFVAFIIHIHSTKQEKLSRKWPTRMFYDAFFVFSTSKGIANKGIEYMSNPMVFWMIKCENDKQRIA